MIVGICLSLHKISLEITNDIGLPIYTDLRFRSDDEMDSKAQALIIIAHGFKGFKEWGFFPYMSEQFANAGNIVLTFDFSMNAIDNRQEGIYFPEIFAKNTFSQELRDLDCILNEINEDFFSKYISKYSKEIKWNGEIYLVGHSLGGAACLLSSVRHPNVNKLVLLATISTLFRNTERQVQHWREKGVLEFVINSTGQKLQLNFSYQDDKDKNFDANTLTDAIRQVRIPILILHPEQDLTVPKKEALILAESGKDNPLLKLELIAKAGHTFNVRHPLESTNLALETVIQKTLLFLNS